MNTKAEEYGRLIYVEPNNMYSIDSYNTIPQKYEDYCITVDLEVDVYKRTQPVLNDKIELIYSSVENNRSFMCGTNGQFSTSFTNISSKNPGTGDYESLGISSIEITYDSWFYPQVTVNFVDVRGASLMEPQELGMINTLDYERNEGIYEGIGTEIYGGSVFKSLFTVPYPEFRLKVKGFYGKGVTLKLCVQKTNIVFNSQTGNFEACVNFIGYMYGVYTDIPMQLVAIAPYIRASYDGGNEINENYKSENVAYNPYWRERVTNGPFYYEGYDVAELKNRNNKVYTNGGRQCGIYTYPELSEKLYDYLKNEKQLTNDSQIGKNYNKIIENIETCNSLLNSIPFKDEPKEIGLDKWHWHSVTESSAIYWKLVKIGKEIQDIKNEIDEYNEIIENYKKSVSEGDLQFSLDLFGDNPHIYGLSNFILASNGSSQGTYKYTLTYTDEDGATRKSYILTREKSGNEKYIWQGEDSNSEVSSYANICEIFKKCKSDKEETEVTPLSVANKVLLREGLDFKSGENKSGYKIIFVDSKGVINVDAIKEKIESLKKQKEKVENGVSSERGINLSNSIGFTPTIRNMFKMTFAHVDTFVHEFYSHIDNIFANDKIVGERSINIGNTGIRTDYNTIEKNAPLPPFTKFFKKSGKTFEEFFPSRENLRNEGIVIENELEEVKFVQELLDAAEFNAKVTAAIESIFSNSGETGEEKKDNTLEITDFIPSSPTDFTSTNVSSPYEYLTLKQSHSEDADMLPYYAIVTFLTRLYQTLLNTENNESSWWQNLFNSKKGLLDFGKLFADIEAYNAFSKLSTVTPSFKSVLDKASENDNLFNCLYNSSSANYCTDMRKITSKIDNKFFIDGSVRDKKRKDGVTYNWTKFNDNIYLPVSDYNPDNFVSNYNSDARGNTFVNLTNLKDNTNESSIKAYDDSEYNAIKDRIKEKLSDGYKSIFTSYLDFYDKLFTDGSEIGEQKFRNEGSGLIFLDPIYYGRNAETDQQAYYEKSFLFLLSIDNDEEFSRNNTLDKHVKNGIAYFTSLLREGGLYYIEDYYKNNSNDFITNNKTSESTTIRKDGKVVGVEAQISKGNKKVKAYFDSESVTLARRKKLKDNFTDFAKGSFKDIDDDFGLKVARKKNGNEDEAVPYYATLETAKSFNRIDFWPNENYSGKIIQANNCTFVKNEVQLEDRQFWLVPVDNENIFSIPVHGIIFNLDEVRKARKVKIDKVQYYAIGILYLDGKYYKFSKIKDLKKNTATVYYNSGLTSFKVDKNLKINEDSNFEGLKQLVNSKVFFIDSLHFCNGKNETNFINQVSSEVLKASLKEFSKKLGELAEGKFGDGINDEPVQESDIEIDKKTDLQLSLYNTLADLYNKWFCGRNRYNWTLADDDDSAEVRKKSDFYNSFYYLDSYYNDIGNDLIVSPTFVNETMSSYIKSSNQGSGESDVEYNKYSIYQFLSLLTQKCGMMFIALPCNFSMYKKDDIEKMFTALSFYKATTIDDNFLDKTSYVCIYPSSPSEHLDIKGSEYGNDGFDIEPGSDLAGTLFGSNQVFIDGDPFESDHNGYTVPAFGVTYGKQNQSFFKNITLNMDNAQTTEYSISTMLNIASKAGEADRSTSIYGQDLYRVYSNYSYKCDVEMLGCMQIMPMMYFQLSNIPMWKGAYQIIKVSHTIKPGDMTTRFTGVRMNRYRVPFTKAFPDYSLDTGAISEATYDEGNATEEIDEQTGNNPQTIPQASVDEKERHSDTEHKPPLRPQDDTKVFGLPSSIHESLDKKHYKYEDAFEDFVYAVSSRGWTYDECQKAAEIYESTCKIKSSKGMCARGTFRIAYNLVNLYNGKVCDDNMSAGGNANQSGFWNKLVNELGYEKVWLADGLSFNEMKKLLGKGGDYGALDGIYGAILVYYNTSHFHATICCGRGIEKHTQTDWWCDKNYGDEDYGSGFVYGSGENWSVIGFIPPQNPKVHKNLNIKKDDDSDTPYIDKTWEFLNN